MGIISGAKSLLQRWRFKYKLAILNENTLEEVWRIRLSKLSVISLGFFVAVVYFFLIALLIIKTPLRGFLPGYSEHIDLERQLKLNMLEVDSISKEVELQTKYVEALRSIVAGEIVVDSVISVDSLRIVAQKPLSEASPKELAFRDSFESEVAVSSVLGMIQNQDNINYLMQQPAQGNVVESFSPHLKMFGITMKADYNSSVVSILDGVILSCDYTLNNIYVMTIQHSDNIVSIYKIRQPFMKEAGEKVHAGEILSTFQKNVETYFEFQLWKDGLPMDPQVFITF